MDPDIVPIHGEKSLREDGMLFVRTESILETMVKTPLLVASLIVVVLMIPIQTSFSSLLEPLILLFIQMVQHMSQLS